jgi:GTP-binding protein
MTLSSNHNIRNIAIIAHVDHGKTTLVDHLFKQSGLFSKMRQLRDTDRVMDNMDIERERGITITAKNCSVVYNNVKINIIDTPGHADFGGEVERSLKMADGALLLVDASEGPLPQTRFVLYKALEAGLKIIVVINKIDRQDARVQEVLDEIYDLFIDLGADDEQLDFPVFYAIGREGVAKRTLHGIEQDLEELFKSMISYIPAPTYHPDEPFQMLVCNLGYSDYTGRLAIGKVFHGNAKKNEQLVCMGENDEIKKLKVSKLQVYDGISIVDVNHVVPGDIIVLSGVDNVTIGDTICHEESPKALERVNVDEPTVSMRFMGNTSPFSGQDGQWVQSQRIFDRLKKEILFNVAIQLEQDHNSDSYIVKGRGEFQLAVLIETMRREGYELCVGRPEIIYKIVDGRKQEPIEHLVIDCDNEFTGIVTEKISARKGRMIHMQPFGVGRVRLEFSIPTRGLIGYRSSFLTDTKGTGIMSSYLEGYEDYRGDMSSRTTGSIIADRSGRAIPYAMFHLQDRGKFFLKPGTPVYEGMILGEHNRDKDLAVNVTKEKKLTNMRASGKDEAVVVTAVKPMTLEDAIEFIKDDEWVEVTPKNIRLRKIILNMQDRKIHAKGPLLNPIN